jgi:GH15 family glucan-1,4-alpha-glucosidase
VWRALVDAASLADLFAQPDLAEGYRVAAGEIRRGAETSIYSESVGRFVRSLHADGAASTRHELAVDASLWALAYFGMFRADDPRMTATMDAVEAMLMVPGPACGLARFEGDRFQLRQSGVDAGVVGNPWPLCTLWLAQYRLMTAKDGADLERALTLIGQVAGAALPSGALPEQVDPVSGEPAGATPLTWAHGAVVLTVLDHLAAQARIGAP